MTVRSHLHTAIAQAINGQLPDHGCTFHDGNIYLDITDDCGCCSTEVCIDIAAIAAAAEQAVRDHANKEK